MNPRSTAPLALALACALGACNDDPGSSDLASRPEDDLATAVARDMAGPDLASSDLSGPPFGCIENKAYCSAYNQRRYCEDTPSGAVWKDETCAMGCYAGACSATQCADECTLGATTNIATCKLWDLNAQAFVTVDQQKLADRAREHDRVTQEITRGALGAMLNPHYAEPAHTTLQYYRGARDAAIWSGSYLAAQGWRLLATGSADAADEVAQKTRMLHDWFKVTGDAGYLARLAEPRQAGVPLEENWQGQPFCTDLDSHCNVDFKGAKWDWIGGTSRDQYTGVMLGLMMAYLASPDEAVRELAREDLTTVALELMKVRTIPANVVINGVPTTTTLTLENVILAPSEYQNGKVTINIDSNNLMSVQDTNLRGLREFLPNFGTLVKQLLPISFPIPRSGSAIMLGGFFAMALRATRDAPAYASAHQQLKDYVDAHWQDWINVAKLWSYDGSCNAKYYPNHIDYISAYAWALLEEDPTRRVQIADVVLDGKMWSAVKSHKNSYFAYLWAGTRTDPPDAAAVDSANTQLGGFPVAPKGLPAIDHLADYPQNSACMVDGYPLSQVAVDVKDRRMDDFIWQRGAWTLKDPGDEYLAFPATDYLAAYWAARYHGLLADDRAGTCNRWDP